MNANELELAAWGMCRNLAESLSLKEELKDA
jgi:hypothetical protein